MMDNNKNQRAITEYREEIENAVKNGFIKGDFKGDTFYIKRGLATNVFF